MHTQRLETGPLSCPDPRIQGQPVVWLHFEQRGNGRDALLPSLAKWPDFRPAAGGGRRGRSRESVAVRRGDGLAGVRPTTEAQQQVANRLSHQRGLSPVPSGRQTYRTWPEHESVAQVVGGESRSRCAGKGQANWPVVCRPPQLFSMLGVTSGLRSEKLGKKDPRIGLDLLGHAGESGEFCQHALEGSTGAGTTLCHPHVRLCFDRRWQSGAGLPPH